MPESAGEAATEGDVYAAFGLAAFRAVEVERVLVAFLESVMPSGRFRYMPSGEQAPQIPTLGQMASDVRVAGGSANLRLLLEGLTNQRNALFHHFFWERAVEFLTPDGRTLMVEELVEVARQFEAATRDLPSILLEWAADTRRILPIDAALRQLMDRWGSPV